MPTEAPVIVKLTSYSSDGSVDGGQSSRRSGEAKGVRGRKRPLVGDRLRSGISAKKVEEEEYVTKPVVDEGTIDKASGEEEKRGVLSKKEDIGGNAAKEIKKTDKSVREKADQTSKEKAKGTKAAKAEAKTKLKVETAAEPEPNKAAAPKVDKSVDVSETNLKKGKAAKPKLKGGKSTESNLKEKNEGATLKVDEAVDAKPKNERAAKLEGDNAEGEASRVKGVKVAKSKPKENKAANPKLKGHKNAELRLELKAAKLDVDGAVVSEVEDKPMKPKLKGGKAVEPNLKGGESAEMKLKKSKVAKPEADKVPESETEDKSMRLKPKRNITEELKSKEKVVKSKDKIVKPKPNGSKTVKPKSNEGKTAKLKEGNAAKEKKSLDEPDSDDEAVKKQVGKAVNEMEDGNKAAEEYQESSIFGSAPAADSLHPCRLLSSTSFTARRVRLIMAEVGDDVRPSHEALFLVNKATEFFLELLTVDAYGNHGSAKRRKSIAYKDLSSTVCSNSRYEFLSDFVPPKVKADEALKAYAPGSSIRV